MSSRAFKRGLFGLASVASMLWASSALPCGGAFGPNVTVAPSQTLVVAHKAGRETYVFRPHFCGEATQFGLILPIPDTLKDNPVLANPELFDELDTISKPDVVKRKVCKNSRELQAGAGGGKSNGEPNDGIDVVDTGQVGIFDWTLVKADTKAAFTDWLDANGFPHDSAAEDQFAHYVTEGWYFVAFKVTAGVNAPPAGKKLCGDFGPIQLGFDTATPVVPTRIAAVSANGQSPSWRVYGVSSSASQLGVTSGSSYPTMTSYSDELGTTALSSAPQLSKLASPGDRLVRLEVGFAFSGIQKDLFLSAAAPAKVHSTTDQIELIDCPTTPSGGTPTGSDPEATDGSASPDARSSDGCAVKSGQGGEGGLAATIATIAIGLAVMLVRRGRRARRGLASTP